MRKSGSNRPAKGTDTGREELSIANNRKEPKMRTLYAVAAAATIVGTGLLSQPASAERAQTNGAAFSVIERPRSVGGRGRLACVGARLNRAVVFVGSIGAPTRAPHSASAPGTIG